MKPSLKDFEHYLASLWNQQNCMVVWIFSGITLLVAQRLKHLPPMREAWVRSLGREDPLEKEMAIHSSTIAWKIPWTEEPGRLQFTGLQRVGHSWATSPLPFFGIRMKMDLFQSCGHTEFSKFIGTLSAVLKQYLHRLHHGATKSWIWLKN